MKILSFPNYFSCDPCFYATIPKFRLRLCYTFCNISRGFLDMQLPYASFLGENVMHLVAL